MPVESDVDIKKVIVRILTLEQEVVELLDSIKHDYDDKSDPQSEQQMINKHLGDLSKSLQQLTDIINEALHSLSLKKNRKKTFSSSAMQKELNANEHWLLTHVERFASDLQAIIADIDLLHKLNMASDRAAKHNFFERISYGLERIRDRLFTDNQRKTAYKILKILLAPIEPVIEMLANITPAKFRVADNKTRVMMVLGVSAVLLSTAALATLIGIASLGIVPASFAAGIGITAAAAFFIIALPKICSAITVSLTDGLKVENAHTHLKKWNKVKSKLNKAIEKYVGSIRKKLPVLLPRNDKSANDDKFSPEPEIATAKVELNPANNAAEQKPATVEQAPPSIEGEATPKSDLELILERVGGMVARYRGVQQQAVAHESINHHQPRSGPGPDNSKQQ